MKIAVICGTFNRPKLLARMIRCFEQQTYQNREMVILDDAGQYKQLEGDRWRIVSINRRFRTYGEKLNAAAAIVSLEATAYAHWDDDDYYFPWALAASVHALRSRPWCQPRQALELGVLSRNGQDNKLVRYKCAAENGKPGTVAYHGQWSYTREAFVNIGCYDATNLEEASLWQRLHAKYGASADAICPEFPKPFYFYNRDPTIPHINFIGDKIMITEAERLAFPADPYVGDLPEPEPFPFTEADIPNAVLPRWWQ